VTWAHNNRSALIRVPRVSPAEGTDARVELRCPMPPATPPRFSAMLAAGLDGIERELPLRPALEEQAYEFDPEAVESRYVRSLPSSLSEAVTALVGDDVIVDALGRSWSSGSPRPSAWSGSSSRLTSPTGSSTATSDPLRGTPAAVPAAASHERR